jgi:hypothetical protein
MAAMTASNVMPALSRMRQSFFGTGQQLRVDQGAGVNNLVRCFQQFLAADGNEVDSTGTGADKVYHRSSPFVCNARNALARDVRPRTP